MISIRTAQDVAVKRIAARLKDEAFSTPQEWNPPRAVCKCGGPIINLGQTQDIWFHEVYTGNCNNAEPE